MYFRWSHPEVDTIAPMKARLVALVVLGTIVSFAQDGATTFRSDAALVLTGFHVGAKKQYVTGLTAADFELLVDGRPRPITTFEGNQSNAAIEIVLLFDTSGSVTGMGLLDEKLFRDNLLAELPGVTLSVYRFERQLSRMNGPTQDPATLRQAFQGVVKRAPGEATFDLGKPSGSLIYEAIVKALDDSSPMGQPAPRMLLVISDGLATGDQDPAAAALAAQEADVPVYPLLLGNQARIAEFEMQAEMQAAEPPRPGEDGLAGSVRAAYRKKQFDQTEEQTAAFASLGDSTGGRSFDPPQLNASTARGIIRSLADEVRAEYIAGFSPEPGTPPASHQIEIRLKEPRDGKMAGGVRAAVY